MMSVCSDWRYYLKGEAWFFYAYSINQVNLFQEKIGQLHCTVSYQRDNSQIKWLVKMGHLFVHAFWVPSIKLESAWVKVQLVSPADSLPGSWPTERSGRRGWSPPGWASRTRLTAAWRMWSVTERERKRTTKCQNVADSTLTSFWYRVWKQLWYQRHSVLG